MAGYPVCGSCRHCIPCADASIAARCTVHNCAVVPESTLCEDWERMHDDEEPYLTCRHCSFGRRRKGGFACTLWSPERKTEADGTCDHWFARE